MDCRFCHIKGIYCQKSKHIYYPCSMLKNCNLFHTKNENIFTSGNYFNNHDNTEKCKKFQYFFSKATPLTQKLFSFKNSNELCIIYILL